MGSGHRLYPAVTSWSQHFFALQVSRDDNKGLKWLFFDLLNTIVLTNLSAFHDLVTHCDQLVTPEPSFSVVGDDLDLSFSGTKKIFR